KDVNYSNFTEKVSSLENALAMLEDISEVFNDIFSDQLNWINYYKGRVQQALKTKNQVARVLHKHRNLCETFVSFESVKTEEVAVYADVEVGTDVDTDELLAEIYVKLHEFINPPVKFKSRMQLQNNGVPVDEIFDGPVLDKGFLPQKHLPQRKNILFLSDFMNLLMDIKGVKAIKYLGAITHPDGILLQREGRSSLKLNPENNFITRLTINKSTIKFFKEGFPLEVSKEEALEIYEKKIQYEKFDIESQSNTDIEIGTGRDRKLAHYKSIQNDFTLNYGIGKLGLPKSASNQRKAQAKQLKAYLLVFEQLLANYHGQLDNIKNLFAPDKWEYDENLKTYFSQDLKNNTTIDIPNIEELYNSEAVTSIKNENDAKYEQSRKDRFLNHFLAQVGFNVDNHAYLAVNNKNVVKPNTTKDPKEPNKTGDQAILSDNPTPQQNNDSTSDKSNETIETRRLQSKIELLKHYPVISSKRACGIDIFNKEKSDNTNMSGLKKLVCQVLNIETDQPDLGFTTETSKTIEDFYLLEHMLLRPEFVTNSEGNYLDVHHLRTFTDPRFEEGPWEIDPYSSIISVVLPGWIGRFVKEEFRSYFERTMNNESPAHISILFYWLEEKEMAKFETAYRPFIQEFLSINSDFIQLAKLRNEVIDVINEVLLKAEKYTISVARDVPRIPISLNELNWTMHDFGKDESKWIYGTGNTARQINYMGTKSRSSYGEGSLAIFNQPLHSDIRKVEVELVMDEHPYSEAGICFMYNDNDDYRLFACKVRDYGETMMSTKVSNGVLRPSLMQVKNIAGQTITLSVEKYKDQGLRLSLAKPGAAARHIMIPQIKDWQNTRFGLYTRYSCNTVFQKIELHGSKVITHLLPLKGVGNMFLGIEPGRLRDKFHLKENLTLLSKDLQLVDKALTNTSVITLNQIADKDAYNSYGGLCLLTDYGDSKSGFVLYYEEQLRKVQLKRMIEFTEDDTIKYKLQTIMSKQVYGVLEAEMEFIISQTNDKLNFKINLRSEEVFNYDMDEGIKDWTSTSVNLFNKDKKSGIKQTLTVSK
ncbi:MAG: hypothetical protein MI922_25440, partial [Bacteroidales bacterium]|nr:hypothetical protein [Bacteroidales bacterium]